MNVFTDRKSILLIGKILRAALPGVMVMTCSIAFGQHTTQARPIPQKGPIPAASDPTGLLKAGLKAPDFTAYDLDGKKVTLSQFKGKVVILDFWATWCAPCQISMPGLENIYRQIKDKGVVVLSLNTWDKKPDFQTWVKENSGTKYHFNFVRDPAEGDHKGIRKASIAKRLYSVPGIPTMYVIDRQGKITGSVLGAGNEAELVKILGNVGIKAVVPK